MSTIFSLNGHEWESQSRITSIFDKEPFISMAANFGLECGDLNIADEEGVYKEHISREIESKYTQFSNTTSLSTNHNPN
jgi:hypothetical protein